MNPFLILGVATTAGDAEIRRAYLEGVRQWPPERDAARFQTISDAYKKIGSAQGRLEYQLFDRDSPGDFPLETVARFCAAAPTPNPLPFKAMQEFLRQCASK